MSPLIQATGLSKHFSGLRAVSEVSLSCERGMIHAVIGPNGAGKSTMFKNIAGFYAPTNGEIVYQGQNISGHKPHAIAEMGIVRTFQETTLFQELTVFENVLVGCHIQARSNLFSAIIKLDKPRQNIALSLIHI